MGLIATATMIEDRVKGFSDGAIVHHLIRVLGSGPAKDAERFMHQNPEVLNDKPRALAFAQTLRKDAIDNFEKRGLSMPSELAEILNKLRP